MSNQKTLAADLGLRPAQMDLFGPLLASYASTKQLSNADLYAKLSAEQALPACHWNKRVPIGKSGQLHSPERRQTRWIQQTMKALGLIERVPGERGVWRATEKLRQKGALTEAPSKMVMLGFHTDLGIALWADCRDVFSRIDEPVHLMLSSLPYLLRRARAYGGPTEERQYVDFVCSILEPIVKHLVPGGSICLNLTNDSFVEGSPARSLYRERLVLALHDRFGLHKMDTLIWSNPTKAPGPVAWSSKKRYQLNVGWEPIYWFTNDPSQVRSDNRRVLRPHTEAQLKLIARGGESRKGTYGDGANRISPGSFSNPTAGAIPRNILQFPHRCPSQREMRRELKAMGMPMHGATFPLALAKFLIEFLTEEGDLTVDICGGWLTSALAAEETGRRWIATEKILEYVAGAQLRFRNAPGFASNLAFDEVDQ